MLLDAVEAGAELGVFLLELLDLCVFFGAEFLEGIDDHRFESTRGEEECAIGGLVDPLGDDALHLLGDESGLGSFEVHRVGGVGVLVGDGFEREEGLE